MFVTNTRRFGRNISNVEAVSHHQKPVAKKTIPRATGVLSVNQQINFVDQENQKPLQNRPVVSQTTSTVSNSTFTLPLTTSLKAHQVTKAKPVAEEIFLDFDSEEELSSDDPMAIDCSDDLLDIDSDDAGDPQSVSEIVGEIYDYLRVKETLVQIPGNYMEITQRALKPEYRGLLINWMAEVYMTLKLLSETLFLAVDIADRVLSTKEVNKQKLHLVGLGAVLIAAKFEETYAPSLKDLLLCCENYYTEKDILQVERVILNTIGFNLCIPSPLCFLRRFSKAAYSTSETHTVGKYLCELSVLSYELVGYTPSQIAAAAVLLSRRMTNVSPDWDATLVHHTGYKRVHILQCAKLLNKLLKAESSKKSSAIYRKYSSSTFYRVSKLPYKALD